MDPAVTPSRSATEKPVKRTLPKNRDISACRRSGAGYPGPTLRPSERAAGRSFDHGDGLGGQPATRAEAPSASPTPGRRHRRTAGPAPPGRPAAARGDDVAVRGASTRRRWPRAPGDERPRGPPWPATPPRRCGGPRQRLALSRSIRSAAQAPSTPPRVPSRRCRAKQSSTEKCPPNPPPACGRGPRRPPAHPIGGGPGADARRDGQRPATGRPATMRVMPSR